MDDKKDKAATPLVAPYDRSKPDEEPNPDEEPKSVDTDAPGSTDENGEPVDFPDLGGRID